MCSDKRRKRQRLLSDLMEGKNMEDNKEEVFYVKSNTSDFANRQKDIFGRLASLEAKHDEFHLNSPKDQFNAVLKADPEVLDEQSTFKVPKRFPAARKSQRHVPGFVKQPGKWIKYSLADVSDIQMTDKSNTDAALSFLNQRKLERVNVENVEEGGDLPKATSNSGKWKMPEYVVGQKRKRKKRNIGEIRAENKVVDLSHLADEDEEFDDTMDSVDEEQKMSAEDRPKLDGHFRSK